MITRVLLKLDTNLKKMVLQEARHEGVELQTIFISAIQDYLANRRRVKTVDENNPLGVEDVDEDYDSIGYTTLVDFSDEGGISAKKLLSALQEVK